MIADKMEIMVHTAINEHEITGQEIGQVPHSIAPIIIEEMKQITTPIIEVEDIHRIDTNAQ